MILDFQTIMLPFLQILSDGEEHTTNETNQKLAEYFNLTEDDSTVDNDNFPSESTPEAILENSYLSIRKNLAQELLLKIKNCSPAFFESLVVELLV